MQVSSNEKKEEGSSFSLPKSNNPNKGFFGQVMSATSGVAKSSPVQIQANPTTTVSSIFGSTSEGNNKSVIIIVLVVLLVLAILGINLLNIAGNVLQAIMRMISPLVNQLFTIFGYTTGNVLNEATDFTTDTLKLGVDIAGGTVKNLGGILIKASDRGMGEGALDNNSTGLSLDEIVQQGSSPSSPVQPAANQLQMDQQTEQVVPVPQTVRGFAPAPSPTAPMPDSSTSLIQAPTTNWCLVGNYLGSRGCLQIDNHDQCQSNQIFATREECVKPSSSDISSTFVPQLFSTHSSTISNNNIKLPTNYSNSMTYVNPEGPPNFPYLQIQ